MSVSIAEQVKRALTGPASAARYAMSYPTWCRRNSDGSIPAPVRVGGLVRWLVADLDLWEANGCPDRATFERIKHGASGQVEYRNASTN